MKSKWEERKDIVVVYLHHNITNYIKLQNKIIEEEEGYFAKEIKGQITKMYNILCKLEQEMGYVNVYSKSQVDRVAQHIFDSKLKKALRTDTGSDEFVDAEELKRLLGLNGYELMKTYFSIKVGLIYLEEEIHLKYREDCKPVFSCFKQLKNLWEEHILI